MRFKLQWQIAFFCIVACFAVFAARHHPFFWDTVQLGAKHAHFYYDNDFSALLLPEEIDSGHPPAFGIYLAACWKLFGRTLPVSHFAVLPFLMGIAALLLSIGRRLGTDKTAWLLALLVFVDPVFASQAILISPDVVLVFFFLLGVWSILARKPFILVIAVIGLGLISMRGMMTAATLFIWQHLSGQRFGRLSLWPYLPGGLLAGAYLLFHYHQTGWIGYHEGSPWAPSFERVDLQGFVRNVAVVSWRMLDYGRVFIWAALTGLIWLWQKEHIAHMWKHNKQVKQAASLFLISLLMLGLPLLFYRAVSAHRYLLPVFLSLSMGLFALAAHFPEASQRKGIRWMYAIVVAGLLTGNFWIYPPSIAQGWDATLAHWPYYRLRQTALDYLSEQNIPLEQVGTAFPEIGPLKYRDLSGREAGMKAKDLDVDRYILWSNVMNDFSDAERAMLWSRWSVMQRWKQGGVEVVVFERMRR